MPSSKNIKSFASSVYVNASPTHVFAVATDWNNQHKWVMATHARPDKNDGIGVGGSIWAFTGILGIGFVDTMDITVWNPPYQCDVLHTGKVIKGTGSFNVISQGTGAVFNWSEQLIVPFGLLGRFAWIFVQPISLWALRKTLRSFRKVAESTKH